MTQPVVRNEWPISFVGPSGPPPLPEEKTLRDIEALPDPLSRSVALLTPTSAAAIDHPRQISIAGTRLDAFMERATPTFQTPQGRVAVSIGFFMTGVSPPAGNSARLASVVAKAGISKADASLLVVGRASPEVIAKATQGLIDDGQLGPAPAGTPVELAARIRTLMAAFGIGLDCAGYVAQAVLAARGVTRAEARFAAPANESLSNLGSQGYVKVPLGAQLRTGDVFALRGDEKNPIGHRAVVREAVLATPAEVDGVKDTWPALPAVAKASQRWEKVVVDSSWGNGGNGAIGGVERRAWWHDTVSGIWAWADSHDGHGIDGIYSHTTFDVFRLQARP
jgi:hypothetical protein